MLVTSGLGPAVRCGFSFLSTEHQNRVWICILKWHLKKKGIPVSWANGRVSPQTSFNSHVNREALEWQDLLARGASRYGGFFSSAVIFSKIFEEKKKPRRSGGVRLPSVHGGWVRRHVKVVLWVVDKTRLVTDGSGLRSQPQYLIRATRARHKSLHRAVVESLQREVEEKFMDNRSPHFGPPLSLSAPFVYSSRPAHRFTFSTVHHFECL